MKNITLSADDYLIEAARQRASAERTTLNEQFRIWLKSYASPRSSAEEAMALISELSGRNSTQGRSFSRDEMNER